MAGLLFLLLTAANCMQLKLIPSTGAPPSRRLYPEIVYFQGKLYFFGGADSKGDFLNDINSFDQTTNTWTSLSPASQVNPMPRQNHAMYATSNDIWIHGGLSPNGKLNDLWTYNIISNTWKNIDQTGDIPPPFYRSGQTAFTYNNTEYLLLGCYGTDFESGSNDLYLFDTSTLKWSILPKKGKQYEDDSFSATPDNRRNWELNYHDEYIYLWGGNTDRSKLLFRYSMEHKEWEFLSAQEPLPNTPRAFFGASIYENHLYVFPGWNDPAGVDEIDIQRIDLSNAGDSTDLVWEVLEPVRTDNFRNFIERDSYGWVLVGSRFFIHGGYTPNYPMSNALVYIDLAQSPLEITIVAQTALMPSPRYYHSIVPISGNFYMYGGSDGTNVLEELWIFDQQTEIWSITEVFGVRPAASQGQAAIALGNNMLMFGGRNGLTFYNTLYLYNILINEWEEMVSIGQRPVAVEGAWIVLYQSDIYIFGGRSDSRANNALWRYNVGTQHYTHVNENAFNAPVPTAFHGCVVYNDALYVMFGLTDDLSNTNTIHRFDFDNGRWSIEPFTITARDRTVYALIEDKIVYIGGSRWNNWVFDEVFEIDLTNKTSKQIFKFDWFSYASAAVYFGNTFYGFGSGASSQDSAIKQTQTEAIFYRFTLEDMVCSPGTYRPNVSGSSCQPCPAGTYKKIDGNQSCNLCPAGTYNHQIGSADIKHCLPCPENNYNENPGAEYCLQCPPFLVCPLGTISPKLLEDSLISEYEDEQPKKLDVITPELAAQSYISIALYIALGLIVIFIILAACVDKVTRKIPGIDIFTLHHNHILNEPMFIRQTFFGGFFSIIAFLLILYLVIQVVMLFNYANEFEQKALIPIVVANEDYDVVKGDLDFRITFIEYGGNCVDENGDWVEDIAVSRSGMSGKLSAIECQTVKSNDCEIRLVCIEWELAAEAVLDVISKEPNAYSTAIKTEVFAQSSIPDEQSFLSYEISALENQVFRGPVPTLFNFYAIPSIFESELNSDEPESFGYHMALNQGNAQGGMFTIESLDSTSFLQAEIQFQQGGSALLTRRYHLLTTSTMLLGLIGGVSGILGGFTAAMKFVEKNYIKYQQNRKNSNKQYFVNNRLDFYYPENQEGGKQMGKKIMSDSDDKESSETNFILDIPDSMV